MGFSDSFANAVPQQYDENGYMLQLPGTDYGDNPWMGMTQQSQANLNTANNAYSTIQDKTNKMGLQGASMNKYSQETSPYPAMANDYGLGSPPLLEQKTPGQAPSSTQGNPWMLTGDALSR